MASLSDDYLSLLKGIAAVNEPRGIIFHVDSATKVFSDHVLPVWANGEFIHIDPLIDDWKRILISASSSDMPSNVRALVMNYYSSLNIHDVATIVGHEMAHHLGCFAYTFDGEINDSMWFEEGLCFYLPRKRLFTHDRFEALMHIESLLIDVHKGEFGGHPVWQFGKSDDGRSFVAALFDYWRATAVVRSITEDYTAGDIVKVFQLFEHWIQHQSNGQRFFDYLTESLNVSEHDRCKLEIF